jgi:hypothetical protein
MPLGKPRLRPPASTRRTMKPALRQVCRGLRAIRSACRQGVAVRKREPGLGQSTGPEVAHAPVVPIWPSSVSQRMDSALRFLRGPRPAHPGAGGVPGQGRTVLPSGDQSVAQAISLHVASFQADCQLPVRHGLSRPARLVSRRPRSRRATLRPIHMSGCPKSAPENRSESLTSFRTTNHGSEHPRRSPCKCARSAETCSPPERIRTSDLRFRRSTLRVCGIAKLSRRSSVDERAAPPPIWC